jgi:hypothetical protein
VKVGASTFNQMGQLVQDMFTETEIEQTNHGEGANHRLVRQSGGSGEFAGDQGMEHVKGLNQPKILDLRNTNVADEGVKKLQEALPNCEIIR